MDLWCLKLTSLIIRADEKMWRIIRTNANDGTEYALGRFLRESQDVNSPTRRKRPVFHMTGGCEHIPFVEFH